MADETDGGPQKNEQVEKDAKTAHSALTKLKDDVKPLLEAAKKTLAKLDASEAVASARSALAAVEDHLDRAEKSVEITIRHLPPKEEAKR